MGWTNSVPIFHNDIYILCPKIPNITNPFVDDTLIHGPATYYILTNGDFETIPENSGIHQFIWEHFQNLNRVVQRMKMLVVPFLDLNQFYVLLRLQFLVTLALQKATSLT